ncbi:subunit p30 of RNase P [Hamiltosporidium tvaerminnensis]|uniref:Subunit p30 of RNase P n=1 Tax=Hamiltosporidium tvaerminnensis TaxID=1176355 RepID=A0A4Q9LS39_9MICR|nr:subunit p30 of RNase P [Hamiltosporidium tvaerminnensis]TBU19121.1 subunit p30 of RNase P [Hamiltosporidium tvaerminnensis]
MYYDLNIQESFDTSDIQELNQTEYEGFCITRTCDSKTYANKDKIKKFKNLTKKIYSKVEIDIETEDYSTFLYTKIPCYDVISLKISNNTILKSAVKEWHPDIITFDFTNPDLKLHKGYIKEGILKNIFYEIPIRDALYDTKTKINWLKNTNQLLKITKGKNTLFSSNATCFTEIKRPMDIVKLLQSLGISEDQGHKIIQNSEECLKTCAFKRYCYRGISNSLEEGQLKRDFIINQFIDI